MDTSLKITAEGKTIYLAICYGWQVTIPEL